MGELRQGGWHLERVAAAASELHAGSAELVTAGPAGGRLIRVLDAVEPALVLGSNQPITDVDEPSARLAGVDIVSRKTAGGAVLVGPGQLIWVDFIISIDDPLWHDDVGRAAWWIGDVWTEAVEAATSMKPKVWRSGLRRTEWSSRICFAGVGPGEVLVDGRKVVGVAQRRTRRAALFQTGLLMRWDPSDVLGLLALVPDEAERARRELEGAALGLGAVLAASVLDALLTVLMS